MASWGQQPKFAQWAPDNKGIGTVLRGSAQPMAL